MGNLPLRMKHHGNVESLQGHPGMLAFLKEISASRALSSIPHYLRLRKLSRIGMNREKGSITHLKTVSGIKGLKALEAYPGYDQETQDEAMEISE
jgi:hypothetical protein